MDINVIPHWEVGQCQNAAAELFCRLTGNRFRSGWLVAVAGSAARLGSLSAFCCIMAGGT